jgi:hypothetical protein
MKFAEILGGQRIIKKILDFLQVSKIEAITERISDVYDNGVVHDFLNDMSVVGKDNDPTLTDFFHVKVDTGVGYKTGERILIDDASITYDVSNLSDTTDDGLGNFVSTPHSTGSFDIPLTATFINYLYIAYFLTTDETQFTLHRITNAKQFFKRLDGYEIQTNTTGINPDTSRFVFLGQVDLSGTNTAIASNISIVDRDVFRASLRRVKIETSSVGKTDRPTTYTGDVGGPQEYFLDDHIKAVGTGTISATNAHGLTLEDLGVLSGQTVEAHRQLEHANGLIAGSPATPYPTGSAMYALRVVVGLGDDYITVKALTSGEFAIVNGLAFDFTDFPIDVNITFTGDPANTYQIYFDSVTQTVGKTTSSIDSDTTKLHLASVTWNGAGDLTFPVEKRRFGTTNRLQRWVTDARPPNPIAGQFGYNMTTNKLEYYNNTTWIQLS